MKVTLTKKLDLKSAAVYLTLQRAVKRTDIQIYLQGKRFDNPVVEKRVQDYLETINIYDKQFHLTEYGESVKKTGMVKIKEAGKYQIWYTENDLLLGNTIYYFKRERPYPSNQSISSLGVQFGEKNYCLSTNKDGFFAFELVREIKNPYAGEKLRSASVDFTWKWDELRYSTYTFSGQIGNEPISEEKNQIPSDENLHKRIAEILPDWDPDHNRYKIPFKAVEHNDIGLTRFEYEYQGKWSGFDVRIDHLPVEPYNHEEAVAWRDRLLNAELEKDYIHPDDFGSSVSAINQKDGFKAYADALGVPLIENYIGKLEPSKKSDRGLAYWHLVAPLDLNLGIPQSLQAARFSLNKGDALSFEELVKKFGQRAPQKVFYYDRFVINEHQQRKVLCFLKCFGVSDVCIITNTKNQHFSEYLENNRGKFSVVDLGQMYHNRKDSPHDRFIVFQENDTTLVSWICSNSIDYIKFNSGGDIQPNTPGDIQSSVTFTKVTPDVLDSEKELANFIKGVR